VFVLAASLVISACGGGSGGGSNTGSGNDNPVAPKPTTGTLGIVFTDKATDEFESIKLSVNEAVLLSDDGQHVLFNELQEIDLLDLEHFMEPIYFGEVPVGTYSKLRLRIGEIELMPKGGNPGDEIYPPLPANGKIDLLDPSGIPILPGRSLLVELDMEANKAFKVTTAGKSMRVNVRPVVKTTFYTGDLESGLPDKLIRFEGIIAEIYVDPAGTFRLCDIDMPLSCIDVETATDTSVFSADGSDALFGGLVETDDVVVIGRYRFEEGLNDGTSRPLLTAFIIEKDIATSAQFTGQVVSAPAEGQFLFLGDDAEATDYLVELQDGSKFFDMNMEPPAESDGSTIGVGTELEIEGVAIAGTPDLLRAALVLITAGDDEQLNGTIVTDSIVAGDRTLQVDPGEGLDPVNVYVNEDAVILFVDTASSTVTTGSFDQLAAGQAVELFGVTVTLEDSSTRFEANEILVDGPPPAGE
jgi:hypothetical protein